MRDITFYNLADYLKQGREIEFSYNGKQYSITNHSGFWYLCDDTDQLLLDTLSRFEDKDFLVSKVATSILGDLTIQEIFDRKIYAEDGLAIL